MDTLEQVKLIIVEQLGVDAAEVTAEASFVDDLGADSLDTVELVMAFEEEFNLEIADEDTISESDGLLPTVAYTFWNPAVLPALAKIVADENLAVVPDGKKSTTLEVAEAANDVVRLAAVEKVLERMLLPF